MDRLIYYEELAEMIMEAEKSHDLTFVKPGTQESQYQNSVWVQRSEKQGSQGGINPSPPGKGQEKLRWDVPALAGRRQEGIPPFSTHCLIETLKGGMNPPTLGRVICITEPMDSNAHLTQNHLRSQTHQESASPYQTSQHIKLTISVFKEQQPNEHISVTCAQRPPSYPLLVFIPLSS